MRELTEENFTQDPAILCRDPRLMEIYENSKCTVDHETITARVDDNDQGALVMRGFVVLYPPICLSTRFVELSFPNGPTVKARVISVMKFRRTTLRVIGRDHIGFNSDGVRDDMSLVSIDTEGLSNITLVDGQYVQLFFT